MNYNKITLIILLIIYVIILLLIVSCSNAQTLSKDNAAKLAIMSDKPVKAGETHKTTILSSESTRYSLSQQRFNDIRAGNELIQKAAIFYSTYLDPEQCGHVSKMRRILIQLAYYGDEVNLNTISEYEVWFESIDLAVSPYEEITDEAVISASDINTHVFDYLIASQDNIGYFFNGEEFDDFGDPHTSRTLHIIPDNYAFTLIFEKPGNEHDEWVISKSVSAEDLDNEPILAGLVNIIETEFMRSFED
jgi:hypothetical protein